MQTSEVLNRAADLIEERGWTQGPFGWPGVEAPTAPLCLEGGILAALGLTTEDSRTIHELTACPAYRAVSDYLRIDPDHIFLRVYDYNDVDGRTAAEVIATLRATAVIEAAKEQAADNDRAVADVLAVWAEASA